MGDEIKLPPGFRFYPTDEELVVHFLHRKADLLPCHPDVIPDLDLYPYDPWDLDGKAMAEGNKWYFYSRRTQNRITENGYWKSLGMEEPIYSITSGHKVGMKKFYFFCINGEPPEGGARTNWIMQEYRLSDSTSPSTSSSCKSSSSSSSSSKKRHSKIQDYSKWVVCRVYEQNSRDGDEDEDDDGTELSCLDEVFLSLDDLDDISLPN